VVARGLLPTPVSPNWVTLGSIGFGLYAAWFIVADVPHHFQWAGLCAFVSTVLDCADGQLARLRKSSSVFGRMLDGSADLIVSSAILLAGTYVIYERYSEPTWLAVGVLALVVAAAVWSSIHTTLYDHYKTVFLKLTVPGFREAESYEAARRRYSEQTELTLVTRVAWAFYLFFVYNQGNIVRGFDPHTVTDFSTLGDYEPNRAKLYREHALPVMRTWRRYFGFGSLMFGIAIALALEVPEYYLLFRLTLMNAAFYGYVRPRQREASKRAFDALASASRLPAN
jgi:phosphatidylglycerophosphate synthase